MSAARADNRTPKQALSGIFTIAKEFLSYFAISEMSAAPQPQQPELWPVTADWDLQFARAPVQKAIAYWNSLLRGRKMPARHELTPRAMKNFIPHVNLVDVV